MSDLFSKRHNFHRAIEVEITIREDAPQDLREYIIQLAYECSYKPSELRSILCPLLKCTPDRSNWSEFPNIDGEVDLLLSSSLWYKVYDFIEKIYQYGTMIPYSKDIVKFESEVNDYFFEKGIGWLMSGGRVEARGTEAFQASIKNSIQELSNSGYITANGELKEAINDLSRRPIPDLSGAIHHSMGALEAVCRKISGNDKMTLGEVIKSQPTLVPRPLDDVISKSWGYSSERGRHIKEGGISSYEEAALIVGIASSLCMYLALKTKVIQ